MKSANTQRPVRTCRPGEHPVDWMFATGQMSENVYRLMRGDASQVAAAASQARAAQVAAAVGDVEAMTPEEQYDWLFGETDRVKAERATGPQSRVLGMEGRRW